MAVTVVSRQVTALTFAAPGTETRRTPLTMGFPRKDY